MEQDALKNLLETEEQKAYKHFMRKEPVQREDDEVHTDPESGMRYQLWKVGMVRNDPKPKTMKVFLDPTPHVVQENYRALQGWYQAKTDPGHRPRPCMTEAVLTQPYGGHCDINCGFCYVNSGTRGYRGQNVTTVPANYGDWVRKQLSKMKTSAAGYFSSFTEPFQRLEDIYHNTQQGATAFVEAGLPIFFLSRRVYPGWAFDLLKQNKYSYAQKSINTPNPDDWHKLSPGAIPLKDNFDQIRELHRQGIYVSIQCNPIVAGVTSNEQIVELIHLLAGAGADHIIFKFAEIAYSSRAALIDIMTSQFKERGEKFRQLFTCNIGSQATIDEEYRINALNLFYRECKKAHVTSAVCYEYKYGRDRDNRINDRVGVSMGRTYLTSDQCHGHRVPMFSRTDLDEPFREVEDCPPSGCLHCEDDNDGKAACGSHYFGSARALEMKDFRVSVFDSWAEVPGLVQIQTATKPATKRLF